MPPAIAKMLRERGGPSLRRSRRHFARLIRGAVIGSRALTGFLHSAPVDPLPGVARGVAGPLPFELRCAALAAPVVLQVRFGLVPVLVVMLVRDSQP